jgi:hypothetical protein
MQGGGVAASFAASDHAVVGVVSAQAGAASLSAVKRDVGRDGVVDEVFRVVHTNWMCGQLV